MAFDNAQSRQELVNIEQAMHMNEQPVHEFKESVPVGGYIMYE